MKGVFYMRTNRQFTAYGYVRSATGNPEQIEDQRKAILDCFERYGLEPGPIYSDCGTGIAPPAERPGFHDLLKDLGPGDTLVVTDIDRICRDPAILIQTIKDLAHRGVKIQLITGDIVRPEEIG